MTDSPPDANRLRPDHLPTPFSAAEIRAACGPGRVNVFRVTPADGDPYLSITRFTGGDDTTGHFEAKSTDLDGNRFSPIEQTYSEWSRLQAHASYAEASTELTREKVDTGAGTFDCWRYTSTGEDGVTVAWFAESLPGPPVRLIEKVGGRVVFEMTLVEFNDPR